MSDKEDLDLIDAAMNKGDKRSYSLLMKKYRDLIYLNNDLRPTIFIL